MGVLAVIVMMLVLMVVNVNVIMTIVAQVAVVTVEAVIVAVEMSVVMLMNLPRDMKRLSEDLRRKRVMNLREHDRCSFLLLASLSTDALWAR